jgi:hypothetical protein
LGLFTEVGKEDKVTNSSQSGHLTEKGTSPICPAKFVRKNVHKILGEEEEI